MNSEGWTWPKVFFDGTRNARDGYGPLLLSWLVGLSLQHLQLLLCNSTCLLTPLLHDQLDAGFDHGLRHEQVGRLRRVDAVEEHVAAGVPARPGRRRVAEVHPRLRRPRPAAGSPRVSEA